MDEILLITRIRTLNKGNQALSAAWLAVVEQAFPSTPIRVLERRPRHLLQYTLRRLAAEQDPYAAFIAIARKCARLAPGPGAVGGPPAKTKILLDETIAPPQRFVALRQRLNLRGRLAAIGRYRPELERRLAAMQRARLVVVNPAGEFYPREPQAALYHLFDAAIAHELGRPTAIVNHTMDITDPTLRAIIPRLYREIELIGFRDEKSVGAFKEMGGDPKNVLVTPDLALTTQLAVPATVKPQTLAVAVNVPEAAAGKYLDRWRDAIAGLERAGFRVELVSNEWPADLPFYETLGGKYPYVGRGLDHDRYGELLGTYDAVVSSRMHTGVLAMCAGAPVVAVEGSSFKITGLYQELGLQRPVIRPSGSEWPAQVVDQVKQVTAQRAAASQDVLARVTAVRERILGMLVPKLRAVAAPLSDSASSSARQS